MSHLSEDRFDQLVSDERARDAAPLNSWEIIAQRAREEGFIRAGGGNAWGAITPWMRAAAGIVILAGGIGIGRYTDTRSSSADGVASNSAAGAPTPGRFSSVDEAWAKLQRASEDYQSASAFLAANNSRSSAVTDSVAIYRDRLAALEKLMDATASARATAPSDPVINQYYLAALGAREATAQQLGAVRPASLRLKGF
jgi:hypothetical protein